MEIHIQNIRSDREGFNQIASIGQQIKESSYEPIELNFSRCAFFEANMAAPLYSAIAKAEVNPSSVHISNIDPNVQTILQKNKFLTKFGFSSHPDTHGTTLPFSKFELDDAQKFYDYIQENIRRKEMPQMSDALTNHFMKSIFEIFQNSKLHSESTLGTFVCGQYFPRKKRIDFSMTDAGIGIRQSVRRATQSKCSSCAAIKWALTESHSAGNRPGGLGLHLIKSFIKLNRGKLQIVSRFGYYEYTAENEYCTKIGHDFSGTCVNIEINTDDPSSYYLSSELNNNDTS